MRERIVLVYVTAADRREAERIARRVLAARLAACVNLLGPIRSIYRWKGRVEDGNEWALLIKTRASKLAELTAGVRSLHSYEVPCIVAVRVVGGNELFLRWVEEQTRPRRPVRRKSAPKQAR